MCNFAHLQFVSWFTALSRDYLALLQFFSWFTALSRDYLARLQFFSWFAALSRDSPHFHVTTLRFWSFSVDSPHCHVTTLRACSFSADSQHCHVTTLRACNFSVDSPHCHVTKGISGASSCSKKALVEKDGEWPSDANDNPLVKGDSCDGDTPTVARHCLMLMMSADQAAQWHVTGSHNSH